MIGHVLVTIYWIVVFALLLGMLLILVVNLLTFPRLTASRLGNGYQGGGMISILVPARNEERCIEACVRSLIEQTYEHLEVIVLDDDSSDNTGVIVQGIIDNLPEARTGCLRLIHGQVLPGGWIGKNFACWQLAREARGDYLLFTDADTVHTPGMVEAVLDCMRSTSVQLLTAQPAFELGSLGERLVVPLLNFTIMTLLPVALVRSRPEPSLATGNGQLLCFQRQAYEAIGGHEKVKHKILEDVLLARAIKTAGYHMIFVDAFDFVRCRMYHSFAEVWAGFSKNLFAFYNYSLPFALFALLLNLSVFVAPPLIAIAALLLHLAPSTLLLALLAYALAVLMRLLLALRFTRRKAVGAWACSASFDAAVIPKGRTFVRGKPTPLQVSSQRSEEGLAAFLFAGLLCFLHPLSLWLECLILLNSIYISYQKTGIAWKGRYYPHK
jgi:chlorobactene glucosyltransferase